MKNKERKKELLTTGKLKEFRNKSYKLYQELQDYDEKEKKLIQEYGEEDYKNLFQMMQARKKQRQKVKHQLEYYAKRKDIKIFFLTFTFDDKKRRKPMTWETLKKYSFRFLLTEGHFIEDYSLNKDFGKEFGRLHGHALTYMNAWAASWLLEEIKEKNKKPYYRFIDEEGHKYEEIVGYYSLEEVKTEEEDIEKLASYIAKLTLHSIKESQSYIATKKGTEYQEYKKEEKLFWKWRKQGIYPSDYERAVYLPHYFNTSREQFKIDYEAAKETPLQREIREKIEFLAWWYNTDKERFI